MEPKPPASTAVSRVYAAVQFALLALFVAP